MSMSGECRQSMIRKSGHRFSEKIMLKRKARAGCRSNHNSSRSKDVRRLTRPGKKEVPTADSHVGTGKLRGITRTQGLPITTAFVVHLKVC
jgi:hypothetical protein